jgi:hypothetical protein
VKIIKKIEKKFSILVFDVWLTLDNPKYPDLIKQYVYPDGVTTNDTYTKQELPVHLILVLANILRLKPRQPCYRFSRFADFGS